MARITFELRIRKVSEKLLNFVELAEVYQVSMQLRDSGVLKLEGGR